MIYNNVSNRCKPVMGYIRAFYGIHLALSMLIYGDLSDGSFSWKFYRFRCFSKCYVVDES